MNKQKHVIVVGFGLAGGLAAIELADAGYTVTLLEKMSFPGGISLMAGGGFRSSRYPEKSFEYIKEMCAGTTPDDVIEAFAYSMAKIKDKILELAKINNSKVIFFDSKAQESTSIHYGYPGYDSFQQCRVVDTPGLPDDKLLEKWSTVINGRCKDGIRLFNIVYENVMARRDKIAVHFETPMLRLIHEDQSVKGVVTDLGEHRADAVILACGGFENNEDMKRQYFQGKPVYAHGHWGNTGDGIKAAQKVGADLWHMWHYHGSYGFLHPMGFGVPIHGAEGWRPTDPEPPSKYEAKPLVHIVVDKNGRRFMNEHPPYTTDQGHRQLEWWSPEEVRYPRIPAYFISDERGRNLGPWGTVRVNDTRANKIRWSLDNSDEIAQGMFIRCDTLEQVAEYIGCDLTVLTKTLDDYNNISCVEGDHVLHRPWFSCHPIVNPPYYVGEIWPIIGNSQGGPRKNKHFQVVDPYGEPIEGLYTSGECGGIWGHVYMGSGNISECFVGADLITQHLLQKEQNN